MLAAAPVVLAPLAGSAILALTQLLGFCVAFGLLYVYRRTLSAIFVGFADWLDGLAITVVRTIRPFGPVAGALRAVDRAVTQALEDWVRGSEIAIAFLWDQMGRQVDLLTQWTADFGNTVAGAFTTVQRQSIPNAERRVERMISHATAAVAAEVARLSTVALPRLGTEIGSLRGRVGTIGRTVRGLREQVSRHSRILTAAGITGLVMASLGRMRLGWVRCTKVGRLGRATCGLDADFLTSILAGTTLMFGTYSLVEFAEEMQDVTEEVAPLIKRFWRAV